MTNEVDFILLPQFADWEFAPLASAVKNGLYEATADALRWFEKIKKKSRNARHKNASALIIDSAVFFERLRQRTTHLSEETLKRILRNNPSPDTAANAVIVAMQRQ